MTLAVVGVVLSTGSLRLDKIIEAQSGMWNIVPQILGAIVFFVSMFAETNRLPFDFAEGESEIIGYHTEYMSFIWIRWTLPRFRYDQLMRLGWKVMLPLSLINLVIVALFYAYGG